MINKKEEKPNPYKEFMIWLYNSYPNAELPEWVIKAITPRAILSRYANLGELTIFLDNVFNSYDLMSLNPLEFYSFLKDFIKRYNINQYNYSFFRSSKRDKTLGELQKKLPHLKTYEISNLLNMCKKDKEYDSFLESLGIRKQEKIKKNKSNKKNSKKTILNVSTFDDQFIRSMITWEDWKRCFNYED